MEQEILRKLNSIALCLMAHPDNEPNSEFADRIDDLIDIKEVLNTHSIVSGKRIKKQDLINAYQAGAIEQKGINLDKLNFDKLKELRKDSDKWLKRYNK